MSFEATVYRVLIASPSDIGEERNLIQEIINEWNTVNSVAAKIILMPVKWETHTTPLLGGRPQAIINGQIVQDSDLLVGLFWTRLGTATGAAVSGTAEEIEQFVESGRPVMLYFSQTPIEPDKLDIEQFTKLKKFKEEMRLRGLTEAYSGSIDFRQKFTRQLALNLNNLIETLAEKQKSEGKEPSKKTKEAQKSAVDNLSKLSDEEVQQYLLKAISATSRDDGWAKLASFAHYLNTYTPVDYHNFGHLKLKPFLEATGLFVFNQLSPTDIEIAVAPKGNAQV